MAVMPQLSPFSVTFCLRCCCSSPAKRCCLFLIVRCVLCDSPGKRRTRAGQGQVVNPMHPWIFMCCTISPAASLIWIRVCYGLLKQVFRIFSVHLQHSTKHFTTCKPIVLAVTVIDEACVVVSSVSVMMWSLLNKPMSAARTPSKLCCTVTYARGCRGAACGHPSVCTW